MDMEQTAFDFVEDVRAERKRRDMNELEHAMNLARIVLAQEDAHDNNLIVLARQLVKSQHRVTTMRSRMVNLCKTLILSSAQADIIVKILDEGMSSNAS